MKYITTFNSGSAIVTGVRNNNVYKMVNATGTIFDAITFAYIITLCTSHAFRCHALQLRI
jgi:hypothetical protein